MQVREIIRLEGWNNSSGWSYEEVYSDSIIEINADILKEEDIDWGWWENENEKEEEDEDESIDTRITVFYYALDADVEEDKPLAFWETWLSDIYYCE